MNKIRYETIFFLTILLILFLVSYFILQNFLILVIFTIVLVYVLKPVHLFFKKILKSQVLTSFIIMLLFLSAIFLPISYAVLTFSVELENIDLGVLEEKLDSLSVYFLEQFSMSVDFQKEFNNFRERISFGIESLIYVLPEIFLELFLILFLYYYFSKEGNTEFLYFRNFLENKRYIILKKKIDSLVFAIVYGQILVRFIQAFIGTIGFLLLGINGAVLWGFTMFFSAFLPIVGTSLVWLPLAFLNFFNGNFLIAILILFLGFFISIIDNLLLPYIISERANIGPVLTLLSILGGIDLFGIYGLLLGPLFLGLFLLFLKEVIEEIKALSPTFNQFIWTEEERQKYKNLKSVIAKEEYSKLLNKKYQKDPNAKIRVKLF